MSLIDVFLCTCATDPIRKGMFDAVYHRWLRETIINLTVLTPEVLKCGLRGFQGLRRKWAEENTTGDIYILAEDDCLPLGKNFTERGIALLDSYGEYAVLSPKLLPFPPPMNENDLVSEGITAGGINFTRAGLIDTTIIPKDAVWDESSQAQHLREKGFKSGWMRDVMCNHLGAMHSTLWPEPYTGLTSINNG